jgi:pyruvate kinase
MPERFGKERVRGLADAVGKLRAAAREHAAAASEAVARAPEESRFSMENLLHYLALRQHDLRPLQEQLSRLGLSSLGRLEAHVDATLCAVLCALHRVGRLKFERPADFCGEDAFAQGDGLLARNADRILGPSVPGRRCRIMVTLPGESAAHPRLIRDLVEAGMTVARINCAHDGPEVWLRMVARIREAEAATGRSVRIAFDLAGPKVRTGPMRPGPAVIRWKPTRDAFGRVAVPAQVRFVPDRGDGTLPPAGAVPVDEAGFRLLAAGGRLRVRDTRGRIRTLEVVAAGPEDAVATCRRTGYVAPGTVFAVTHERGRDGEMTVAAFPPQPGALDLLPGDRLRVRHGSGEGGGTGPDGVPEITCDFAPLFRDARAGEPVLFDDGLLGGVIRAVGDGVLDVEITRAAKTPFRLRAEKGINVPETDLRAPALTDKDREDLRCVLPHADMISLSFVRRPEDVDALVAELEGQGREDVGIVLKIENRAAFGQLGAILLTALRHPPVAVMIARGDLGVEVGFERMAEVQEEMLWLCEAAHVPVIWATQVLETLAQRGMATRAEVTDAAMSGRAECVMLNKGPHIVATVRTLSDILTRMEDHQEKKSALMRPLRVAGSSPETTGS